MTSSGNGPAPTLPFAELLLELGRRQVRLRRVGQDLKLRADKQALDPPLLSSLREHKPALLEWIGAESPEWKAVDPPLVDLSAYERERIAISVQGGAANIQDIYPLTPLQEGIFFHYLASGEADPYLLPWLLAFDTRERLDRFIAALQAVIDRHDILRTSIAWEGLASPVQVVWREAFLPVDDVAIPSGADDAAAWMLEHFQPHGRRLDAHRAPLMHAYAARDVARNRWLLLVWCHHLAVDHTTLDYILEEVQAHLCGAADRLPAPMPFRTFVAQARSAVALASHEAYFRRMLADVDAPTAPYGYTDVRGDGSALRVTQRTLHGALARRLRDCARRLAVSPASLFHVAWALVLARLSGRHDVVFGTTLFGRMQAVEGASRVLGPCINTLPLRIAVGAVAVEQAVRETHVLLSELLAHEHAPLALAQRCSGVPAPAPLFCAALNYRYSQRQDEILNDSTSAWSGMEELFGEERGNYPLHVEVDDFGEAYTLTPHVLAPIDPERIGLYLETALGQLAHALEQAPHQRLDALDILPPQERDQILNEWNATVAPFPEDRCVHELFEAQAQRTPDAVALVHDEHRVTYGELNRRANQLAHCLVGLGVRPDRRVVVAIERSIGMVVGILAVLKAGGAYVPIEPGTPAERLAFMLADSAPAGVLTQQAVPLAAPPQAPAFVIDLDRDAPRWASLPVTNIRAAQSGVTPRHLAYTVYTSGSTGQPKGVMVEHRQLCHEITAQCERHRLGPDDRVLQFVSTAFDVCVEDVFTSLSCGATLVLSTPEWVAPAAVFWALCRAQGITAMNLPTAYCRPLALDEAAIPACVRHVVAGGEAMDAQLVQAWFSRPGHRPRLYNAYGPSETTVCASLHECFAGDVGPVPIGRPLANVRIYILDTQQRLAPVGVVGEICIAGAGVARGYLERATLDADRFVRDPFMPGARMYRTGDLGRWRADGAIEFIGRADAQVKVRGFRIEPGEIEACCAQVPGVQAVRVLAADEGPGERRLVAYYTASKEIPVHALREHLALRLPEYMVPAAFVHLERFPLTANGKIDPVALAAASSRAPAGDAYEGPVGALEKSLVAIWAQVLHRAPHDIGRRDNFFDLGGHSLRVVQVAALLQNIGLRLPAAALFKHPTIEQLARHLSAEGESPTAAGAIPLRVLDGTVPLFVVHEVWGEVLYGPALAASMEPTCSVYGLAGRDVTEPPVADLAGHASRLVQSVRAVQARGPYRLLGWSFGGVLAYEIARQLIDAGEHVEFLGLLDAANPTTQEIAVEEGESDAARLLAAVEPSADPAITARLASWAETAPFDEFVQALQEASLLPARMSPGQVRNHLAHHEAYVRALAAYRPRPLDVPVHLYRVSDDREPLLGWDRLVPRERIQVIQVPGSHRSMVSPPHVARLAEAVSAGLRG
jgi:amino acid adenylation domain-containing protein